MPGGCLGGRHPTHGKHASNLLLQCRVREWKTRRTLAIFLLSDAAFLLRTRILACLFWCLRKKNQNTSSALLHSSSAPFVHYSQGQRHYMGIEAGHGKTSRITFYRRDILLRSMCSYQEEVHVRRNGHNYNWLIFVACLGDGGAGLPAGPNRRACEVARPV